MSSDDDLSSVKSLELETASKTSEPSKSVRDNNGNDIDDEENDDDSSFLSRKRKKNSSRMTASQKRIISDDEDGDDSDDDDMELSRISEMVKRKRLAKAEKLEKKNKTLISSYDDDNEVDPEKEPTKLSSQVESGDSSSEIRQKSDKKLKEASTDRVSKSQKRKRKPSERSCESEDSDKRTAKQECSVPIKKIPWKHKRTAENEHETTRKRKSREAASNEDVSLTKGENKLKTHRSSAASSQLGNDGYSHGSSPKEREKLSAYDNKNPYISDISDAEVEDEKGEDNGSRITCDMFRANIFTSALAVQGSMKGMAQSSKMGTDGTGLEDTANQEDSLSSDKNIIDDADKGNLLQRNLEEDGGDLQWKPDGEKITLEEESEKTVGNNTKRDFTKSDKKKISKDKSLNIVDVFMKRRKKKSESTCQDYISRESTNEQIGPKENKDGNFLGTLQNSSREDGEKVNEAKMLLSAEANKETGKVGEKSDKSSVLYERELDLDTCSGKQDDPTKQSEVDDRTSKISKKVKKKKSRWHDLDVDEISSITSAKGETGNDDSRPLKRHRYSEENIGDNTCLKIEQPENEKEECDTTASSLSFSKSRSLKEKHIVTGSKHLLGGGGEEKKESLLKALQTESSKDESNLFATSKRSEDSGMSSDEIVRNVADKEKLKESKKERVLESNSKVLSENQKEQSKRGKSESDSAKKNRKDQTDKNGVLSRPKDKVKDADKDSKFLGADGTKISESIGKLRDKIRKSVQENKAQNRGLKESKLDLKEDNDQSHKDVEKKGNKEHKKVVSKDGKGSKLTSNREKDAKQGDTLTPKTSPVKDSNDNKNTTKKEHRTPVKSKEVDLKIWDFGLPSPIKMQKLSKPKDHKKLHSKEGKLRKTMKSAESKESVSKARKLDLQEVLGGGSSELKSTNIELICPVSKRASEESSTQSKVRDDYDTCHSFDNIEAIKDEENLDLPIGESPVKENDFAEVGHNASEEPSEAKGDSSFQFESLGKATFEASDATSMDSPQTSQTTFETTSVNMDATCSVTNSSEELLEPNDCSEKETVESAKNDQRRQLEEVPDGERPILPQDRHTNEEVGDAEIKDNIKVEEEPKSEDHGSPLLLDKLSELGAGSDFEDHLGPFHGTKLEETDIDIKELSHPEDTLKMLTQEINGAEAAAPRDKLVTHEYPSVKMTGHDFTMLSEQINEKIQHLSSGIFVSELSEEDRHIVNISMEIAEDLGQEGDEHVSSLAEPDSAMIVRRPNVMDSDSDKLLPTAVNETQNSNELNCSEQHVFHSETPCITSTSSINTTCVSAAETVTTSMVVSKITNEKEERPITVDPGVVKTSAPASHQGTEAPRPLFARSRTVDLEPRGIAQVVADIDLNSISSCILNSEKSIDSSMADASGNEGTMNEVSSDSHASKETKYSDENSRDRFKKKPTFISSPATWRKALFTDYGHSKPDLPVEFKKFAVMTGDYRVAEAEIDSEV